MLNVQILKYIMRKLTGLNFSSDCQAVNHSTASPNSIWKLFLSKSCYPRSKYKCAVNLLSLFCLELDVGLKIGDKIRRDCHPTKGKLQTYFYRINIDYSFACRKMSRGYFDEPFPQNLTWFLRNKKSPFEY